MASNNNEENKKEMQEADELEEDYYAILNLSKDVRVLEHKIFNHYSRNFWSKAPDKEITQAYHRFGRIYHPDKHKTEESKRNAEILFAKIKKVYDGTLKHCFPSLLFNF